MFGPIAAEEILPARKSMQRDSLNCAGALAHSDATSQVGLASVARDLENAWYRQLPKPPAVRVVGILRELLVQSNRQIWLRGRSLQEENVAQTFPLGGREHREIRQVRAFD